MLGCVSFSISGVFTTTVILFSNMQGFSYTVKSS